MDVSQIPTHFQHSQLPLYTDLFQFHHISSESYIVIWVSNGICHDIDVYAGRKRLILSNNPVPTTATPAWSFLGYLCQASRLPRVHQSCFRMPDQPLVCWWCGWMTGVWVTRWFREELRRWTRPLTPVTLTPVVDSADMMLFVIMCMLGEDFVCLQ